MICASTGNTSASAAAYAARAGLRAVVLLPQGAVALGKLAQARAAGARSSRCAAASTRRSRRRSSSRPRHARPRQLAQPAPAPGPEDGGVRGRRGARRRPGPADPAVRRRRQHARLRARVRGARPAAADRLGPGGDPRRDPRLGDPDRHARPPRRGGGSRGGRDGHRTSRSSRPGRTSPQLEGLFCEPSSAAGIAGLRAHPPEPGSRVVCVITGHGLKDPATVDRTAPPPVEVEPDADAIAEAAA